MNDNWLLVIAAAGFLTGAAAFLNIHHGRTIKHRDERRAYGMATYAADFQLEEMHLDDLLEMRTRLAAFAEREAVLLHPSVTERLDRIIAAKDTDQGQPLLALEPAAR